MDAPKSKLDILRASFIDTMLAVAMILGVFATFFTILRDYPDYINLLTFARVGFLLIFVLLFFSKKKFSENQKLIVLILSWVLYFWLAVTSLGFFSTMKWLIILGPVVMVFLLPRIASVIMAGLLSIVFFYSSWNLMAGFKKYLIPPSILLTDIYHWSTDLGTSLICVITIIILITRFKSELNSSISEISQQNEKLKTSQKEIDEFNSNLEKLIDDQTSDLKKAVDDLAKQNQDLKILNSGIQKYNQEISEATARLKLVQERVVISDKMASLGLLTAGICHEIKNPLNHIHGSSLILENFLKSESAPAPTDQVKLINALNTGVNRIKAIIDSLNQFDYTSSRSGEWVNLVTVVKNCRSILEHLFNSEIDYEFKTNSVSAEIQISSDLLHQVVLNILQNAVESLPEKGKIHVALLASDDRAIIEISDNGTGIPEELKGQITDPFFSTKSTELHTGLGLYHVQKLMNDVEGKLIIDSEINRGTIVRLIFNGQVRRSAL